MSDLDLSAFFGQFRDETADNVRRLIDGLLVLERQPGDRPTLDGIFRAVHTIKGSARMLGLAEAGKLAHTMESVLGEMRAGQLSLTRELNDLLLAGGDMLLAMATAVASGTKVDADVDRIVAALEAASAMSGHGAPAPVAPAPPPPASARADVSPAIRPPSSSPPASTPSAPGVSSGGSTPKPAPVAVARPEAQRAGVPPSPPPVSRPTVRVRVDRLDRLLNTTGELVVSRQIDREHQSALDELVRLAIRQRRLLLALTSEVRLLDGQSSVRQTVDALLNQLLNGSERVEQRLRTVNEEWAAHTARVATLVDDLEAEVMATRLQPIAGLFAPIPRAVRELARALGREVELVIEGEATEADRKIIESLGEALLHMVRNAIDHGLEPPEERLKVGKPAQGTLRLSAHAHSGQVYITVADDGRGMDSAAIRASAVRKGMISAEDAALLGDEEALELIFQPGFSTSTMITDISGRGVGLDVVRSVVTELGGRVEISSELGKGTAISLVLPLTLLTARVIIVGVAGQMYAIPSSACLGGLRIPASSVATVEGRPMVEVQDRTAPLVSLADLLRIPSRQQERSLLHAVLIGSHGRPLALLVDDLLDEREVVIKSLGPLLAGQRFCNGAIILGDGRVALLLNTATLLDQARESRSRLASRAEQPLRPPRLLVAEDSFMTRELIRSILQSAGYEVETAVDGLAALDKLRAGTYDLLVSDVEMPHLTGYELTSRVREELGLRDLPVILITSLSREEDRRRGLLAGAQAYIVKSQFDQSNLLETIRQLLGR